LLSGRDGIGLAGALSLAAFAQKGFHAMDYLTPEDRFTDYSFPAK